MRLQNLVEGRALREDSLEAILNIGGSLAGLSCLFTEIPLLLMLVILI